MSVAMCCVRVSTSPPYSEIDKGKVAVLDDFGVIVDVPAGHDHADDQTLEEGVLGVLATTFCYVLLRFVCIA